MVLYINDEATTLSHACHEIAIRSPLRRASPRSLSSECPSSLCAMSYRFYTKATRLTRTVSHNRSTDITPADTNLASSSSAMAEQPHEAVNPIHPSILPKLDPAFIELYNKNLAHNPPRAPDLALLRRIYSTQYSYATAPAPECAREYEVEVDGWERYPGKIKIRIYIPEGTPPSCGWPVHIDFHGGGWGLGDLQTEAHILRHICVNAAAAVIDVDYRLIPEYPFPTAIYDCFEVLKLAYTSPAFAAEHNIDPRSISMGGLSAGANIALILNHLARDHDPSIPVKAVVAGTPVLSDISQLSDPSQSPYPSMSEMALAPTLNWQRLKWFDNLKTSSLAAEGTSERQQQQADISWFRDAFTAPNYKDLATLTWIGTAGCDPLRDEGEAYGNLLRENGNQVDVKRFDNVPHPFQHMDAVLSQARDFIGDCCAVIKQAHYEEDPS